MNRSHVLAETEGVRLVLLVKVAITVVERNVNNRLDINKRIATAASPSTLCVCKRCSRSIIRRPITLQSRRSPGGSVKCGSEPDPVRRALAASRRDSELWDIFRGRERQRITITARRRRHSLPHTIRPDTRLSLLIRRQPAETHVSTPTPPLNDQHGGTAGPRGGQRQHTHAQSHPPRRRPQDNSRPSGEDPRRQSGSDAARPARPRQSALRRPQGGHPAAMLALCRRGPVGAVSGEEQGRGRSHRWARRCEWQVHPQVGRSARTNNTLQA
jgi:hypothetical protein